MFRVQIDMPDHATLSPNGTAPDWKKPAARRSHKEMARVLTKSELARRYKVRTPFELPPEGVLKLTYTVHRMKGGKQWDDDNLVSAMKWARDGIALALGVNDKRFELQPVVWGDRRRHGCVIVEISHD